MKVSELDGADLDYWVARANGAEPATRTNASGEVAQILWDEEDDQEYLIMPYSTDWQYGGPIIERENIGIEPIGDSYWDAYCDAFHGYDGMQASPSHAVGTGKTPLIAAMRAYVAGKFGESVE